MIRHIEGHHNHTLKLARKLQKKKHRREKGLFLAEGMDLLVEALASGHQPAEVLVRPDLVERLPAQLVQNAERNQLDIVITPEELLEGASGLGGAADVVAIYAARGCALADAELGSGLSVYLYRVGDPGNVGTLIRSAVAFGATGVVTSPETADAFGPRALRAGMGAQFLLPVVEEVAPADLVAKLDAGARRGEGRPRILVADAHAPADVRDVKAAAPVLLVLGPERGELPDLGQQAERVTIPQVRFDSLNVAMAGTILLYELARQRAGSGS